MNEQDNFVPSVPAGEKQATYEVTDKYMAPCPDDKERKPIEKVYIPLKRTQKEGESAGKPLDEEPDREMGFLLYNVLSPAECKYYIDQAEALGMSHVSELGKGGYRVDYRNNDRVAVRAPEVSELIWSRIKDLIHDVHVEKGKEHLSRVGKTYGYEGHWKPSFLNDVWRLCKYLPGGHFAPHFDGYFVKDFNQRSMKTFMLYLNGSDDGEAGFEGGTTNFVDDSQALWKDETTGIYRAQEEHIYSKIKPVAGMAIVFNHRILHEGERVTSGQKYIMRSDLMFERVGEPLKFDPKEEQAILLMQEAEDLECDGHSEQAVACYRKAFKLWPPLEDSVSFLSN